MRSAISAGASAACRPSPTSPSRCTAGVIKAVIGPNGAGKTTLFNLVSGYALPDTGSVRFRGEEVRGLPAHELAGRGMARTFQQIQLVPGMSVLENVLTGRHRHTRAGFLAGMLRLPGTVRESRAARERCLETLAFLGLADLADAEAVSLAYGQQRLVELARALVCEPALLLLDEPAAGLNMRETEDLAGTIGRINATGPDRAARRARHGAGDEHLPRDPRARRRPPRRRGGAARDPAQPGRDPDLPG